MGVLRLFLDYRYLAETYSTPLFVYDFDAMTSQYTSLKSSFEGKKSLIAYAVKANSNLSIIKHFASLGAGADCVSIGEVKRALLAGVPKYKIIFSGVGKSEFEIEEAIKEDILFINAESFAEIRLIESVAKSLNRPARVSVRVNPNIDPKTHPYISTGLKDNKFGVSIEEAKAIYVYAKRSDFLEPVGVHFHIGSQLTELDPIIESAHKVASLAKELIALEIDLRFFDVGGGIGIKYLDETTIDLKAFVDGIFGAIKDLDLTVITEPGRFLVGNAGVFVTKVLYEKINEGKRFVVVDGAMNDLIRPTLYDAYHHIEVLGKSGETSNADVVGPVCESGDYFAKDRALPATASGDILLIRSAGAYAFSMSSNYNTRLRSAEVAIEDGKDHLIRRRETYDELFANELSLLKGTN